MNVLLIDRNIINGQNRDFAQFFCLLGILFDPFFGINKTNQQKYFVIFSKRCKNLILSENHGEK
jgi:hypothetical protein